jgi:hypothetical protein
MNPGNAVTNTKHNANLIKPLGGFKMFNSVS